MTSLPQEQQLYLQAVMSRWVLPEKSAAKLYAKCCRVCKVDDDESGLDDVVSNVQSALDPFGLHYSRRIDVYTGKAWHAIVNVTQDDIAQLATEYSPEEINYFKILVKCIMEAEDQSFAIPIGAALRASPVPTGNETSLSKLNCQNLCSSFVAKGWLFRSAKGFYMLGNRALMELDTYLKNEYESIYEDSICTMCREFVTKGFACPTSNCTCRLHTHCAKAWLKSQSTCPNCRKQWDRSKARPIGEDAASRNQEDVDDASASE